MSNPNSSDNKAAFRRQEVIEGITFEFTKACDKVFMDYWLPKFREVLPRFPELKGQKLVVGSTWKGGHVQRVNVWANEEIMRLSVGHPNPEHLLAHELTHLVYSEKFTDLVAMAKVGDLSMPTDSSYLPVRITIMEHLGRAIYDLAAMAVLTEYPVGWFEARLRELYAQWDIIEAVRRHDENLSSNLGAVLDSYKAEDAGAT
jgi:hypothetical protein